MKDSNNKKTQTFLISFKSFKSNIDDEFSKSVNTKDDEIVFDLALLARPRKNNRNS